MKVKIKKLHPNAVIPEKASEFSGGWDVTVTEIIQDSSDFVICKFGFSCEFPINYKLTLVPRSSLTKTTWLIQNSPGLGDADYRGEYQLRFRGIPVAYTSEGLIYSEFPYKVGDRVGQVYIEEVIPIEWEEVLELNETTRGKGGYGSTNK